MTTSGTAPIDRLFAGSGLAQFALPFGQFMLLDGWQGP
jgi:hypothetical protein